MGAFCIEICKKDGQTVRFNYIIDIDCFVFGGDRMIGNDIELIFGSLRSALDYLKKPYSCYSSIAHCCKGDTKTAYGYKWEYIGK